ncbi:hypothetical protein [Hymenobacter rubidus]|uniref:hypothetical protein n=1 Tax=Hymenobacter rubidus TaxID=1441626 RepID=UPI00191CD57F|nr:hypothetical protein [Hymenobacter rubidus]
MHTHQNPSIIDLLNQNDTDSIGRLFLKEAYIFICRKEFGKAYEFLLKGIDLTTCQCEQKEWIINADIENVFDEIYEKKCVPSEYYFCKAFVFSYSNNRDLLHISNYCIDKYMLTNNNYYGNLIKGIIALQLDNHAPKIAAKSAIKYFNTAKNLGGGNKVLYFVGKLKEEKLSLDGIEDIYKSFLSNVSSTCCGALLQNTCFRKSIKFDLTHIQNRNLLVRAFNNFRNINTFEALLKKQLAAIDKDVFNDFVDILAQNYFMFINQPVEIFEENNNDTGKYSQAYYDEYGDYQDWGDVVYSTFDNNPWRDLSDEEAETAYWNTD